MLPEYGRFLNVAEASLAETESLLLLARDLGFASEMEMMPILGDVDALAGMLATLRTRVEDAEAREARAQRPQP